MADDYLPKRLFRFSIGMMLFAVLCVCGYFGGYRGGFDAGLQGGRDHARLYVKEYDVAALTVWRTRNGESRADVSSLIDLFHSRVAPESWMHNGPGRGTIQISMNHTTFDSRHASVLITQSQEVHDKIDILFNQLRNLQVKNAAK
jgi:hypothetical protein